MKRPGEVSVPQAARILDANTDTVRRWAARALEGMPSRLESVRVDIVGRYWLRRDEVLRLREEHSQEYPPR